MGLIHEHYFVEINLVNAVTGPSLGSWLGLFLRTDQPAFWKQVNETVTLKLFSSQIGEHGCFIFQGIVLLSLLRMFLSTSLILKCTPSPWSS